jgi:hypothetical protein
MEPPWQEIEEEDSMRRGGFFSWLPYFHPWEENESW